MFGIVDITTRRSTYFSCSLSMSAEEEYSSMGASHTHSSSSALIGVKQRAPRQHRSCDFCRRRKRRCDGLTEPDGTPTNQCSNCIEFGVACTYINPTKQRGPASKLVADLKQQIAILEAKLRSLSVCSLCAQPLPQQDTPGPHRDTPNSENSANEDDDELVETFRQISIQGIQGKVFGSASGYALLSSALAEREKYLGRPPPTHSRRRVYWEPLPWDKELYEQRSHYVYPANDLIDSLLQLYFANVHPSFPVLHRPSFKRDVAEGLHIKDTKFGALLLAVLAVASRYSDDPRVFIDGETTLSSGCKFIAQVQIFTQCPQPTIHDVQFCFLMALYSLGTSVPRASWLFMGIGNRSLQYWCSHDRNREGHKFEHELWNRAFWCFFALDRIAASFIGRSPVIHTDDYDIDPLLEVDDEYWEQGFTQPLGKPSLLSYFACFIRLCEILGDTLHRLYASRRLKARMGWTGTDWEQGAVAELDSAMNEFFDSIPVHLRLDPNARGVFLDQSAMIHAMYYYNQIMIHRPYIHTQSLLAAPSLFVCTRAARSVLQVTNIWIDKLQRPPLPWFQNFVFISAVILLLNTFGSKRAGLLLDADTDLGHVETALKILKFTELRFHRAGRFRDLIQELQSLDGLVPRNEVKHSAGESSELVDPSPSADLPPTLSANAPGVVNAQDRPSFEPGVSIEQLLAETDPAWDSSGPLLDNEMMSMWMAAPTDFMNMDQWDAYLENINRNGVAADPGAGAS
ncbi:fungal-specific transcription factor domain-containing protein [Mycena maculata]|uniref:Fungal-specific transcription factor domain-containing protein n=1 Tax=Mycena maculata TaxID=230809 RepID=A0AAD7IEQ1_9AGAR|nr:fungal-specific transcription factor domain-containing protein [Mycena maculata]